MHLQIEVPRSNVLNVSVNGAKLSDFFKKGTPQYKRDFLTKKEKYIQIFKGKYRFLNKIKEIKFV